MIQEDKDLLLVDLSARLPYGVKVCAGEDLAMTLRQIDENCFCECWENEDFKCHSRWMLPYLRPMSSMTKEERKEYDSKRKHICDDYNRYCFDTIESIDWLNAHHFDYRTTYDESKEKWVSMIEKGLAIKITEENNPYET